MTFRRPTPLIEPEDLSVRARRGGLRADEHAAFESALDASATLRTAHLVGRDFDEIRRICPGDDELIQRAQASVLAPRATKGAWRRLLAMPAVAVLFGASAAAATSAWLAQRSNATRTALATAAASAQLVVKSSNAARLQRVPPPAPVAQATAEAARARRAELAPALVEPASTPPLVVEAPPSAAQSAPRSPASLFRDANAARRTGDVASARALYSELQASFPQTREAQVSRVSLGKLCLGSGMNRDAERNFRQYLSTGGGDLAEEALVGRAEALSRLGEMGEERRVWQELQSTHPSSVYFERASRRIEELGRADSDRGPKR